jgi:Domain of unknown function (DUF5122) beta-propeller
VLDIAGAANWHGERSRMLVARYMPDGRLDRSFGRDGVVNLRLGYHSTARAIAWSRRGVLVAGRVGARSGDRETVLMRLRPNGRLDRGFGRSGVARLPERAEPVALLPTPERIFLVYEGGVRVVLGFDLGGRLEYSLPSQRLRRGTKWDLQFEAALQGRRPVLVWTMIMGPSPSSRSQIELARLGN